MKITLAIDEKIVKAGREYARRHHLTLNSLVQKLLEQASAKSSKNWLEESFALMDKANGKSKGKRWERDELYRL